MKNLFLCGISVNAANNASSPTVWMDSASPYRCGKGWGKKHSVVDYVFTYKPEKLVAYHMMVMFEMKKRGYKPDPIWENCNYRGKVLGEEDFWCDPASVNVLFKYSYENLYPEHNDSYLKECLDNLAEKGIILEV